MSSSSQTTFCQRGELRLDGEGLSDFCDRDANREPWVIELIASFASSRLSRDGRDA
jgi:hypothetical protein